MQQSDAPGPSPIKARRPRKIAALGAAAEHARRWQDLGDAFDALVRALAASDALATGLSRRVHALWHGDGHAVLEWQATELRSEGRLVLAADVQRGRFILPAHTAGLRLLAMRKQSVADDVLRLAAKLGELERSAITPDAFADWLWRGGALGFDVVQHASAAELGRSLLRSDRPAVELWGERSEQAVALWNDLSWVAAQQLDAGALAQRYAAPLEQLQQRLQDGALALGLADAQALRAAADDPLAWARAEVDLMRGGRRFADAIPSAHVAFHLLSIIEHSAQLDLALLQTIEALDAARCVAGEPIDTALLGGALGQLLLVHGVDPAALRAFVDRADAALRDGLLRALLGAGGEAVHGRAALVCLLEHWGAAAFFGHVSPKQLGPALGSALIGAALATPGTDASALAAVLELLPVEAALAAACAHPNLLRSCAAVVERRIAADPPNSGPLLAEFAARSVTAARITGSVLLARQGSGFGPEALAAALRALVRVGLGAEFVLPLWEARGNATHVRLAALYALAGVKPLLAQALARRVGNLLEPPEIREALEELRWKAP